MGQSLKRVGVSKAGRVRGEVEAAVSRVFGLRSSVVLCSDQSLVFGLSDLVLLEVKWSGGNGSGESDKRGWPRHGGRLRRNIRRRGRLRWKGRFRMCERYELKIDYITMDQVCTWS